jgi:hypothetical protein
MKNKIIMLWVLLFVVTVSAQEKIKVSTEWGTLENNRALNMSIINKSKSEMVIIRTSYVDMSSRFGVTFLDEKGQSTGFFHSAYIKKLEPARPFILKPDSVETFSFRFEYLLRASKEPDKVRKIKVDNFIIYYIWNDKTQPYKKGEMHTFHEITELTVP